MGAVNFYPFSLLGSTFMLCKDVQTYATKTIFVKMLRDVHTKYTYVVA